MFADTRVARAVFKKVCADNALKIGNTYTEKTTKNEPDRRSVVFQVFGAEVNKQRALEQATVALSSYPDSKPKITESEFRYGYGGLTYLRVIAYI